MNPTIELTEPVLLSILTIVGVVVAGVIGGIGWLGKAIYETRRTANSAKRDTKETLHQVKNDHSTNLRDDIDAKHRAIELKHESVIQKIDKLDESVDRRFDGHLVRFNHLDKQYDRLQDMILHIIEQKESS